MFSKTGNRLIYMYDAEEMWIEPWGRDSLRVRATKQPEMHNEEWALLPCAACEAVIYTDRDRASITNGAIRAELTKSGLLSFYNSRGEIFLKEYTRTLSDFMNEKDKAGVFASPLEVGAREWKPDIGGDYRLTVRFEANKDEKQ